MTENPFQDTYRPYDQPYGYGAGPTCRHRHGIIRTALTWAAIGVIAFMAFGLVTWAFGAVFTLAAFILKVALAAAIAAFVWRRVAHRRPRNL